MINEVIDKLTVIKRAGVNSGGRIIWYCKCECSRIVLCTGSELRRRNTTSCYHCNKRHIDGIKPEAKRDRERLWRIWYEINRRCNQKLLSNKRRKDYSERGISIDKNWKTDFETFYNWALLSGYRPELQIDRINNDGNYTPSNCRWVTPKENMNNTRRNIRVFYENKYYTAKQIWQKYSPKISYGTFCSRLNKGWAVDEALYTDSFKRRNAYG